MDTCRLEGGDGRTGVVLPAPRDRSQQILEWFGWEPLETIQCHPLCGQGCCSCVWCLRSWLAVAHVGCLVCWGQGHTCCAPSPASDLHEPVPEPGPTELQRLEAALHQTPRSVQVSPRCGSKRGQCSPTEPLGHLNSFLELLTKPSVLLSPQFAAEPPPGVLGEQQQEGRGEQWDGAAVGWEVSPCCWESSLSWQCPHGTCACPLGAVAAQGVCGDRGVPDTAAAVPKVHQSLQETVRSFKVTNEELAARGAGGDQDVAACDAACKVRDGTGGDRGRQHPGPGLSSVLGLGWPLLLPACAGQDTLGTDVLVPVQPPSCQQMFLSWPAGSGWGQRAARLCWSLR